MSENEIAVADDIIKNIGFLNTFLYLYRISLLSINTRRRRATFSSIVEAINTFHYYQPRSPVCIIYLNNSRNHWLI